MMRIIVAVYEIVKSSWGWTILVAAFVGWLLARVLQNLEKPDLKLEVFPSLPNHDYGAHKFLAVRVTNKNRGFLRRVLFGNRSALFCRAQVKFTSVEGSELLSSQLDGRWASTGEPVLQIGSRRLFQYNRVPDLKFEHIMPGRFCDLAIAIKHEGEPEFYAFDNESYAYLPQGFRDPNKSVSDRICTVDVQIVSADGAYPTRRFEIHNPSNRTSTFKIENR